MTKDSQIFVCILPLPFFLSDGERGLSQDENNRWKLQEELSGWSHNWWILEVGELRCLWLVLVHITLHKGIKWWEFSGDFLLQITGNYKDYVNEWNYHNCSYLVTRFYPAVDQGKSACKISRWNRHHCPMWGRTQTVWKHIMNLSKSTQWISFFD